MRTRAIETYGASSSLTLATLAMLAVALTTPGAAQAEEQLVARGPQGPAMVVAAVEKIDPSRIGAERDHGTAPPEGARENSATVSVRSHDAASDPATLSLTVAADLPGLQADAWDSFRRSIAGAATSSCFDAAAPSQQDFAAEGLLRLPFLVQAAADGTCR